MIVIDAVLYIFRRMLDSGMAIVHGFTKRMDVIKIQVFLPLTNEKFKPYHALYFMFSPLPPIYLQDSINDELAANLDLHSLQNRK